MPDYSSVPDDVHDLMNIVSVGQKYRGDLVTKIEFEKPVKLDNGKAKMKKLFTLASNIIVVETTIRDYEEIMAEYNEMPMKEIKFPKVNDVDFDQKSRPKSKRNNQAIREEDDEDLLASPKSTMNLTRKDKNLYDYNVSKKDPRNSTQNIISPFRKSPVNEDLIPDGESIPDDNTDNDDDDENITIHNIPSPSNVKSIKSLVSGTTNPDVKRERIRQFPKSAWVFPTEESLPSKGERNNLQGIWNKPPKDGNTTEPVELMIHDHKPRKRERVVNGVYGYKDGTIPDADGVVDPSNVVFYPPGQDPSPNDSFEKIGYWSSPESTSETTLSWRFDENADMIYVKKHTVSFMGTMITFTSEEIKR